MCKQLVKLEFSDIKEWKKIPSHDDDDHLFFHHHHQIHHYHHLLFSIIVIIIFSARNFYIQSSIQSDSCNAELSQIRFYFLFPLFSPRKSEARLYSEIYIPRSNYWKFIDCKNPSFKEIRDPGFSCVCAHNCIFIYLFSLSDVLRLLEPLRDLQALAVQAELRGSERQLLLSSFVSWWFF